MIKSFRHKGLERLFKTGNAKGLNAQFIEKLRRMLKVLNDSREPQGMNLPSYRLHALHGDRKGQWAVWVSGNWRVVFEFEGEDAAHVDLIDYH
jgi:proteic killer suppression protein